MKKIKITFVFIILWVGGFAQFPDLIDSLKTQLSEKNISDLNKVKLLLNLAYHYSYRSDPGEALKYGKEALLLAQKVENNELEAYAYNYIGNSECRLGNNVLGVEALIKSAELFRKNGLEHLEASALASIGGVFGENNDLQNAIKYNNQALLLFYKFGDTISVATTQSNIGEAYREMGMYDSAFYYFETARFNFEAIKDTSRYSVFSHKMMTTVGNLGMIYAAQGNLPKAKELLNSALNFFLSYDDYYRSSVYQNEIGVIFTKEGEKKKGEELILKSLELAQKAELKEQIRDISHSLFEFYKSVDKPDKALFYYQQYNIYDDSIKNVEVVRTVEKQQSRFELNKKEEEIVSLNKINQLQKNIAFVLSGSILIVTMLLFVLYRKNQSVRKNNELISKQKLLVEQREKEKGLLLRELNHRVKNNLQMVSSMLNLHSRQLKDHPDAADALKSGQLRVEALTLIHQKLYRDDVDTKIDIKEYIEELTKNLVYNFGREFELQFELQPFVVNIDKAVPLGLIINELVTNSLKYGKIDNDSPLLQIAINRNDDEVSLMIRDNGKGLPQDFDYTTTNSFGLKLVHSLVKQLNGELSCQWQNGTGWTLILDYQKLC